MKMNQEWKKHGIELRPGMRIKGKWHKKSYVIKRKLGSGAIGAVYLCELNGKQAALKISDKGTSMTVEVNVLKSLKKVQGNRLGPYLLDVDDWISPHGTIYSFYVMEYLRGETMTSFINHHGREWIGVFMLQLLEDLERLHHSGWVFGDLKTENLLILHSPPRIRWVDVGGTTQIGRAIKEYTEFYDRGYWGLGSRRAEPSYDLFAFVMVFLHVYYPKRFEKSIQSEKTIFKKIDDVKSLSPYSYLLKKAILGKYQSSYQMKQELIDVLYRVQNRRRSKNKKKRKNTAPFIVEAGGITILAVSYYLFSLLL
ncbi:serine/threonine protein kinase [Virgibacillus profundi]|uniref:Serine/threonine protein kinase n=1 Tax=Virgibacillus profundi TaxID=2024555 RepID=A0A2A2IAB3_9BACI|nr:protein kinase [Virgibacillus profundi]PAV28577.1 serine/threonine protein kinase [Virgibacillus profundi]PXY52750.1 serine/threonine protein kinase [Virgibacillus profundi]